MRAVFDLDDTISIHENRDYANAKPILPVIRKMREMKQAGWEIVIYSARGQVSCKGDLALIESRNRATAEKWLKDNGVPFDELIFGKPLGDLYVDDRAMSAKEFANADIGPLYGGGSGSSIYRIGGVVKKYFNSAEDVKRYRQWIDDNGGVCKYPAVYSYLYNSVFMEYIQGERLVDDCEWEDIIKLIETVKWFGRKNRNRPFDLQPHIKNLLLNKSETDDEWNAIVDKAVNFLINHETDLAKRSSYCHGDLILSNVIKAKDGLYLLDSRYFRESSTYLFDYAKLRMSLMGYESLFGLAEITNREYLWSFDNVLDSSILPLVKGLELMHVCRLYRYKNDLQKYTVKELAREVIKGNERLFE